MIDTNYTYRATVHRVIDGDTVDVDIDVGFHMTSRQRVRLARIDTPELNSKDALIRAQAVLAKARITELVSGQPVVISTKKSDSFGRYLGEIFVLVAPGIQANVSDILLTENLAVLYK